MYRFGVSLYNSSFFISKEMEIYKKYLKECCSVNIYAAARLYNINSKREEILLHHRQASGRVVFSRA